ncbi:hypothetical protein ES703_111509 [subsurface metagenome]
MERMKTTYDDIGGLEDELLKIREIIELPLWHPEIFKRVGIEGIILSIHQIYA